MTSPLFVVALILPLLFSTVVGHPDGQVLRETDLNGKTTCTVLPASNGTDDVPALRHAFTTCGAHSTIVFPAGAVYRVASRLHATVHDVSIEWRGKWQMSADLDYWRHNSYPIVFQNHAAGIVFSGSGIRIHGHGTGGIDGNGDAWYSAEEGTTLVGRPMPFVLWNVTDVDVRGFSVWQPPLWSVNIMNGTNMHFEDIYANATAFSAPAGDNWVQNTDGFDTMDVRNLTLSGLTYQGGDDCVAIKPRSYDITLRNISCHGGNGIAIGSLGQYEEDSSVANVSITDVVITRHNEDMHNSAYIKTWVGIPTAQSSYESAGQPNGGGWGTVQNVTFANYQIRGADSGPAINQDNGSNGSTTAGTSKMLVKDIVFTNFTGWITPGKSTASVSCSSVHPCFGIAFEDIALTQGENGTVVNAGQESCSLIAPGGVEGLNASSCNT